MILFIQIEYLSVGTVDMVIPNVCWGSCTECLYSPQAPAGLTCSAGNPGLYLQMTLIQQLVGVVILEQEMVFGE